MSLLNTTKMLFNNNQSKLWHKILQSIEAFRKEEISYCDLVYSLEGTLDAGELKNEEIIKQWYDLWTPLEIWSATKGDRATIEDVDQRLSDMESFLKKVLLEN